MRAGPRRRTAPDPVLAFGRGQGVDIEQDLPRRLVEAKALERGAPPQAARVFAVEPEIVEPRSAPRDHRKLVGPIENRCQGVAVGGELSAAEGLQRAIVLGLDPGKRALALDVLEPQIGIVVWLQGRRPDIE